VQSSSTLRALLLAATVGTLSCVGTADIPVGPDLDAIEADYASPSFSLTPEELEKVRLALLEAQEELEGLDEALNFIPGSVENVTQALGKSGSGRIRLDGETALTIKCPGTHAGTSKGRLAFRLGVEDTELTATASGAFQDCGFAVDVRGVPHDIVINVPFSVGFGAPVPLRGPSKIVVLLALEGTVRIDDKELQLGRDLRISQDGLFEFRLDLAKVLTNGRTGTVVVFFDQNGFGVRDASGTYRCGDLRSACIGG
jgi:hypothetical protein